MNKNNIIKKVLVYFFAVLILYLGTYYFLDSLPKSMTIEVKMRQSVDNNIQLFYKQNPYDTRGLNIEHLVTATEDFQTAQLKIDENYIYSLDLGLYNMGQETSTSNVEIEKITVKTLFSKRTLDSFSGFNSSYECGGHDRFTLVDGFVFSPFQLTTKIKIISLFISIFLVFLFRKPISKLCNNTKLSNDNFKVAIFTGSLFFIFILNSASLYKNYDYLSNSSLPENPKLVSYDKILNTTLMKEIERYSKQQFLYNNTLIEDYYAFNRLLAKNQFGATYITKYNNEDLILQSHSLDKDIFDTNIQNVIRMDKFLEDKNIPYLFFLAPDKQLYFDDKFPCYLNNQSQEMQEYFLDNLNINNVQTYPLSDYIYAETIAKGTSSHFRTDHHWTIETAFIAYNYILDKLIENNIDVSQNIDYEYETLINKELFTGSGGRAIAYGNRYNQVKDDFSIIYPVNASNYSINRLSNGYNLNGTFLELLDFTNIYNLNNYVDVYNLYSSDSITNNEIVNSSLENDNTIVILGDSYSKSVARFLTANFKNVIIFDQRNCKPNQIIGFLEANADNIDVVINLNYTPTLSTPTHFNYFD